jgi:hypothetical protein
LVFQPSFLDCVYNVLDVFLVLVVGEGKIGLTKSKDFVFFDFMCFDESRPSE